MEPAARLVCQLPPGLPPLPHLDVALPLDERLRHWEYNNLDTSDKGETDRGTEDYYTGHYGAKWLITHESESKQKQILLVYVSEEENSPPVLLSPLWHFREKCFSGAPLSHTCPAVLEVYPLSPAFVSVAPGPPETLFSLLQQENSVRFLTNYRAKINSQYLTTRLHIYWSLYEHFMNHVIMKDTFTEEHVPYTQYTGPW